MGAAGKESGAKLLKLPLRQGRQGPLRRHYKCKMKRPCNASEAGITRGEMSAAARTASPANPQSGRASPAEIAFACSLIIY